MLTISGPGATRAGAANDYEIMPLGTSTTGLKGYLRITDSAQDAQLQFLLDVVHQAVFDYVEGRILRLSATPWVQIFDGPGDVDLYLPQFPLSTLTALEEGYIVDSAGTFAVLQAFDTTSYILDKAAGAVRALNGQAFSRGRLNHRVTYTAGYSTAQMPPNLQKAVGDWVGVILKRVKDKSWDIVSISFGDESKSVALSEMPESSRRILDKYKAGVGIA